jgi:hypothetical protein
MVAWRRWDLVKVRVYMMMMWTWNVERSSDDDGRGGRRENFMDAGEPGSVCLYAWFNYWSRRPKLPRYAVCRKTNENNV